MYIHCIWGTEYTTVQSCVHPVDSACHIEIKLLFCYIHNELPRFCVSSTIEHPMKYQNITVYPRWNITEYPMKYHRISHEISQNIPWNITVYPIWNITEYPMKYQNIPWNISISHEICTLFKKLYMYMRFFRIFSDFPDLLGYRKSWNQNKSYSFHTSTHTNNNTNQF